MKLTKRQAEVLAVARDHKSIIVGGIDGDGIRKDVIYRLADLGLLKYKAPSTLHEHSEWVLTDAGIAITGGSA